MKKAERWTRLKSLVRERYPYCRLRGVEVEDGCIVRYAGVQYTRALSKPHAPQVDHHGPDTKWSELVRLCSELDRGRIGEIHFVDGSPVLATIEADGESLSLG